MLAPRERLGGLAARLAAEHPSAVAAYVASGAVTRFRDIEHVTSELGSGLPVRTRIGLYASNSPASSAALFAIWRAGSSAVMISGLVPEPELQRRLEESGCAALIRDLGESGLESSPVEGEPTVIDGDEALIIFTSGTTGRPKGARLTFSGLLASLRSMAEGSELPTDGRPPSEPPRKPTPIFAPLAHMAGTLPLINAWFLGKPVLLIDRFRAADVFDLVERFQLSALRLSPAMLFDLANWPEQRSLAPVKSVTVGTAALPEAQREKFERRFQIPVLATYGQTELSGAIAFERYSDVREGRRPPGTVGRLAPGVEIRFVDPETGRDLAFGEVGEIWVRSRTAMAGYTGGSDTVQREGGWLKTGDLGRLDGGGFLGIVGRARDVIICGGFNVYPAVVERAIGRIEGVGAASVVGLDDERLGQIPVAAIVWEQSVPPLGEDELRRRLRDQLAPYEVPRRLVYVASLPLTDGGKISAAAVRGLFAEPT